MLPLAIAGKKLATGGGGYTAEAVTFDGASYLSTTSGMGASDTKELTVSFWANSTTTTYADQYVITTGVDGTTGNRVTLYFDQTLVSLTVKNSSGATIAWGRVNNSGLYHADGWTHVVVSLDLTNTANRHIVIDGVEREGIWSNWSNDNIDFSCSNWVVGSRLDTTAGFLASDTSELYLTNEYIDLSSPTNIAKFISDGSPVDLGTDGSTPTGTAPLVYMKGDAATWNAGTNSGSGNNFTMSGPVTNSAKEPVTVSGPKYYGVEEYTMTAASTSASAPIPAPAAGDLIVIVCAADSTDGVASATGFTALSETSNTADLSVLYKIADGTEGSSVSVTLSVSSRATFHGAIFSGVDQTTPYVNSASTTGSSGNATSPAMSVTEGNLVLSVMALDNHFNSAVSNEPDGMFEIALTTAKGFGAIGLAGSAYVPAPSTGTYTPSSFANVSRPWAAMTIEFAAA